VKRRTYSEVDLLPNSLDRLIESQSVDRNPRKPKRLLDGTANNVDGFPDNNNAIEPWFVDTAIERTERLQSTGDLTKYEQKKRRNDTLFLMVVGTCSLVGVVGLVAAAIFWYKIQKRAEAAIDAEYPSYGVTGPGSSGSKISPSSTMSDRKLAQSAQMFHYQQQRQQMMAQEKAHLDVKPDHSDDSDDEAPGGGDYTVYECPGLAPTGEMEVRNPLFAEPDSSLTSSASVLHPTTNNHYPQPLASTTSSSPPKEKSLP
jgi:predicted nucleic acid-binding Zn ribbon protein